MSDQNLQMSGMSEMLKILTDLPAHLEQQILDKYLKSTSQKFVVEPLKAGLSYSSNTEKWIKVQPDKKALLAFVTGPTTKAFWVRFADLGTVARTTKAGHNRGYITGKFNVPRIVEGQIQPIIDNAHKEIGTEIDKFLNTNKKQL